MTESGTGFVPTTASEGEPDAGAAAALAPMVEVWFRILADHVPDHDARCRACTIAGTGAHSTPWPCSLQTVADRARRLHAAGNPAAERSRGRRRLRGVRGSSCAVTPLEREFLQLAADGRSDMEIAEWLDVPERTVRTTLGRIGRILGVPERADLLVLALRAGAVA